MTGKSEETNPGSERQRRVHCRRLDRPLTVEEHKTCLYCHGTRNDITCSEYAVFCDYEPGKDPVDFGFPEGFGRYAKD